jgi:membrane carboxypeptidase/penicillin-binding protein PbpC
VLALTAFSYGVIVAVGQQLSGLDPFKQATRQQVDGYIYAGDGHTILAVLRGSQSRVLVQSDQISPWIKQAIVATEDKRFYEHRGVDIRGMARALLADIRQKSAVQGGSTITQQFVKNELTGNAHSITRKLKEAALAWRLEQVWPKDRILTAYLNTIYFGNGAYGIERAARTYFGHDALKLTLPQAALLAGIPEDPSLYDPVAHPQAGKARRALVLRLMLQQHDITDGQYVRAARAPMPKPQNVHLSGVLGQAPYFGEYVKAQLLDQPQLGAKRVFGGGFRVETTIDLRLQKIARDAIDKWLPSPTGPQAALVAINPSTGAVLAMYGGRSFHASQFNLAVQGERQPGSSFKPFVLATALKEGISPLSTFVSKPVSIFLGNKYWNVHNFEGEYLGPIDLVKATSASDNSVFAQLTKVVGPANVARTAHELGITSHLDGVFSIGLGTQAVNPLEMARDHDDQGRHRQSHLQQHTVAQTCDDGRRRGARDTAARGCRDRRNGHSGRASELAGGGQDRDHRELRRCMVRRLHAAARHRGMGRVPEGTSSDAHGVPRPGGRGRDVPRGDLEVVHAAGPQPAGRAAREFPRAAVSHGRFETRHVPRRPHRARQRALQLCAEPALFRQAGAEQDRELQAERGRRSGSDRAAGGGRSRAARRAAADAVDRLQVRKGRTEARRRARAEAEQGAIVGV